MQASRAHTHRDRPSAWASQSPASSSTHTRSTRSRAVASRQAPRDLKSPTSSSSLATLRRSGKPRCTRTAYTPRPSMARPVRCTPGPAARNTPPARLLAVRRSATSIRVHARAAPRAGFPRRRLAAYPAHRPPSATGSSITTLRSWRHHATMLRPLKTGRPPDRSLTPNARRSDRCFRCGAIAGRQAIRPAAAGALWVHLRRRGPRQLRARRPLSP